MTKKDRQIAGDKLAQENAEKTNKLPHEMSSRKLKNLYYLKKEIKELKRRISKLESAAAGCTARITGLPGDEGISDKIGESAVQIADLRVLLDSSLKKALYELNKLNRYIDKIENSEIKLIFTLRYINGTSWQRIAFAIGYQDESIPRKKHNKFLKNDRNFRIKSATMVE